MKSLMHMLPVVLFLFAARLVSAQENPPAAPPAPAAVNTPAPAEAYLRLCELINRADRNFSTGSASDALADYRAAEKALAEFRSQYPIWNTPIVEVRGKHVGDRLKFLAANPPANPAAVSAPPPVPEALPLPRSADVTNEFRAVLQDLRAAEADNALLLARLREALSSTPALSDPRELERAEQRIAALRAENDTLREQLDSASKLPAATGGSADTKRLRREIEDLNRKLKAQSAAAVELIAEKNLEINRRTAELATAKAQAAGNVPPALAALEQENTALKQQLASAQAASASAQATAHDLTEAREKLQASETRLAALQAQNTDLQLQAQASPKAAEVERLQTENAALRQQAGEAAKRVTEADDLNRQWQAARAEVASLKQSSAALETQLAAVPKAEALAQLQTENRQLREQSEAAAAKLAAAPKPEALARAQGEVQSLRDQLANANARSGAPNAETAALREQLVEAQKRADAAEAGTRSLQQEKTTWLQQSDDARRRASEYERAVAERSGDQARIRDLESRLKVVEQQLAEANAQMAGRSTKSMEKKLGSLNNDVLALRARLNVYESKAIPYSREELALFQKPAPAAVVAARTLPARKTSGAMAELETRGEKQLAANQLPQAEETLTQVVQANEKEIRALCNLANSQAGQGKFAEADATIQKALAQSPNDAASLAVLGYVRYGQNRYDEALDTLSRAASLKPKDAGIQVLLGVTLAEKGLRPQAETAFRKALQLEPNHADAHRNLAVIYLTQQPPMIELARWHYQKALAANAPPNPEFEQRLNAPSPPK